jgi:hypothetical protein
VLLTKPAIAVLSEVFALCALEFPVAAQDQSGGTRARVQEFLSEGSPATRPRNTSICVSLFDALRNGSSELNFIRPRVEVSQYNAAAFSTYQSRCPALPPLNEMHSDAFALPYVASHPVACGTSFTARHSSTRGLRQGVRSRPTVTPTGQETARSSCCTSWTPAILSRSSRCTSL